MKIKELIAKCTNYLENAAYTKNRIDKYKGYWRCGIIPFMELMALEDYTPDCFFDLRESIFLPHAPLHRDYLLPDEAGKLQLMMRMDFPTMHLFRMNRQERQRLLDVALTYYRLHLPDFPELRSLQVLQEVYTK